MIRAWAVTDEKRYSAFNMLVDAERTAKQWREADPSVPVRIVELAETGLDPENKKITCLCPSCKIWANKFIEAENEIHGLLGVIEKYRTCLAQHTEDLKRENSRYGPPPPGISPLGFGPPKP